jgi:hypothetical protein
MGDVASAVVKFVLSIFEGLVGGVFRAVADTLSSVPILRPNASRVTSGWNLTLGARV